MDAVRRAERRDFDPAPSFERDRSRPAHSESVGRLSRATPRAAIGIGGAVAADARRGKAGTTRYRRSTCGMRQVRAHARRKRVPNCNDGIVAGVRGADLGDHGRIGLRCRVDVDDRNSINSIRRLAVGVERRHSPKYKRLILEEPLPPVGAGPRIQAKRATRSSAVGSATMRFPGSMARAKRRSIRRAQRAQGGSAMISRAGFGALGLGVRTLPLPRRRRSSGDYETSSWI